MWQHRLTNHSSHAAAVILILFPENKLVYLHERSIRKENNSFEGIGCKITSRIIFARFLIKRAFLKMAIHPIP
jgi:hypothetical protein